MPPFTVDVESKDQNLPSLRVACQRATSSIEQDTYQQDTCEVPLMSRNPNPSSNQQNTRINQRHSLVISGNQHSMHSTGSSPGTGRGSSSSSRSHHHEHDPGPHASHNALLRSAERAVSARVLPPLLLLVVVSYLDRTALSFASIQMSQDLGLSGSLYGLGSGAFFLAYALGQIPSNFLLLRFGGPGWLAFICIAWGAAASSFAFVSGPISFVVLRMLLGLAESGAFPGTWYYISCWYPAARTTVPYTIIETGITVSQVVAAPIAAGLLLLDGRLGLRGWQWLFMMEGVPALLLGAFISLWLPSSIQSASFLSAAQRSALLKAVQASPAAATGPVVSAPQTPRTSGEHRGDSAVGRSGTQHLVDEEAAGLLQPSASKELATLPPAPTDTAAQSSSSNHQVESSSSSSSSSSQQPSWHTVLAVARNRVVLYAGSWRILHDIPGNGVLYWTPKIVQALLLAAAAASRGGTAGTWGSSGSQPPAAIPPSAVAAVPSVAINASAAPGSMQQLWPNPPSVSNNSSNSSFSLVPGPPPPPAAAGGPSSRAAAPVVASAGVQVVLLSAIPYAAASAFHLGNAWHSQRVGESKLHIALTWLLGALALLLLPFAAAGALSAVGSGSNSNAHSSSIAAFVMLTVAHVGVNGANGLQTGLVAGCLCPSQKAVGLAMYNTIGCIGSAIGPLLIGVLYDASGGGYSLAMWLLGCSLAGAAAMVLGFKPPEPVEVSDAAIGLKSGGVTCTGEHV